jgi:NADH-quinone oxidoreductase subunit J
MTELLFYLFSAIALGTAAAVVLGRNAVNCAMFMILSFAATAALFVLLNAWFLGAMQIIVYAGAVMVLFLFIVMLLNVEQDAKVSVGKWTVVATALIGTLLFVGVLSLFSANHLSDSAGVVALREEGALMYGTGPKEYGYGLFTKYMLPVQVSGFLLLVAMIGVIVISKRLRADGEPAE